METIKKYGETFNVYYGEEARPVIESQTGETFDQVPEMYIVHAETNGADGLGWYNWDEYCQDRLQFDNSVKIHERTNTAQHRFFIYIGKPNDTYPFSVCDGGQEPKSIAKFKTQEDAKLFLDARRNRYITEEK